MITILLDSSFRNLAVGIAKDGKLIDQISYEAWQRQSELLIPELDALLKRNSIARSDISDIMVAIGPGSYTGVRIALTIAKVLSFALGVPLYAVSSLQIMKVGDRPTVALINARSGRSYIGVYQKAQVIVKDTIMTNDEVKYFLATHPDFAISGDAGYLNLVGQTVNTLEEMISLKEDIEPVKDKLGLTQFTLRSDHMIVRPMKESDLPAVLDIEATSFLMPWNESQFQYELKENPFSHLYVAMEKEIVIGFIDFWITFDSGCVNQIAVLTGLRRKGIATALLNDALARMAAAGVNTVTLEVRTINEKAIRLYEKAGFSVVVVKKAYYDNGDDALYMEKRLSI